MSGTEETPETEASPKQKRLTPEQWTDAKIKWRSGQFSLGELSELYGVSKNSLHRRFKRNDIKRGADAEQYEQDQKDREIEEAIERTAKRDREMREKADSVRTFVLSSLDAVSRGLMKSVANSLKQNHPLASSMEDAKAAKEIILALKNTISTVGEIMPDVDLDEDELPALIVEGLTQKDIEDLREEQRREDEEISGGFTTQDLEPVEEAGPVDFEDAGADKG